MGIYTYLFFAIYIPNCLQDSLQQSFYNKTLRYYKKIHLVPNIYPSKFELVQSYTLSLLFFIRRNSSQLSQPSYSNCSNVYKKKYLLYKKDVSIDYFRLTLIREHTRHALKPRKSLGIDSIIFFNNYFPEKYRMLDSDSIQNFKVRKTSVKLKLVIIVANTKKRDDSEVIAFFYFFF